MYKGTLKNLCEYIWIGGKGEIRSKTRIIDNNGQGLFPVWNFDASSTGQAESNGNTEGILIPVKFYKNPLRKINNCDDYLVLCETYDIDGNPLKTNNRHEALKVFNFKSEEDPWYGLEQEYFIGLSRTGRPVVSSLCDIRNVFNHYCGVARDKIEREIAEKHMEMCLEAGLKISGINSEVALNQWEFQVGPCVGIDAADQLIVARYLLERIAEKYDVSVSFSPKPCETANGSGCHTNFSTKKMRNENGIEEIYKVIDKLEQKHEEHISIYGEENELRLTGQYETASYTKFSWGKGTRNTSVRIPNQVVKDGCGYFEDRRPAANMDPYLVTSKIFKTCCLE
jgi:glutamine synthetase